MVIGTAIHAAILEPDSFAAGYVVAPEDAPPRPSSRQINAKKPSPDTIKAIEFWSDFTKEAAGKIIMEAETWANILGARDAVLTHPSVKGLFTRGEAEVSYFGIDPETGALVKCRPDYDRLNYDGMIVDVKSTQDASPEGFGGSATKFRYDVQDPWYRDVVDLALGTQGVVEKFGFVAVESKPPFQVGLYYSTPEQLAFGRRMGRRDLRRILECTAANSWPDFAADKGPQPLRIRPFARREAA
jgi:exodeoxyribonuclease VIII